MPIRKKGYEESKGSFYQFYSGGPMRPRPFASSVPYYEYKSNDDTNSSLPHKGELLEICILFIIGSWITQDIEIQAANKIKSAMKSYI